MQHEGQWRRRRRRCCRQLSRYPCWGPWRAHTGAPEELQPLENPHWSMGKVWGGRSRREELLYTDCNPHSPSTGTSQGEADRGAGNDRVKLSQKRWEGGREGVSVCVSHHPTLILNGKTLNCFSPSHVCFAHDTIGKQSPWFYLDPCVFLPCFLSLFYPTRGSHLTHHRQNSNMKAIRFRYRKTNSHWLQYFELREHYSSQNYWYLFLLIWCPVWVYKLNITLQFSHVNLKMLPNIATMVIFFHTYVADIHNGYELLPLKVGSLQCSCKWRSLHYKEHEYIFNLKHIIPLTSK